MEYYNTYSKMSIIYPKLDEGILESIYISQIPANLEAVGVGMSGASGIMYYGNTHSFLTDHCLLKMDIKSNHFSQRPYITFGSKGDY